MEGLQEEAEGGGETERDDEVFWETAAAVGFGGHFVIFPSSSPSLSHPMYKEAGMWLGEVCSCCCLAGRFTNSVNEEERGRYGEDEGKMTK